ncbi:hypothetical protein CC86DRAFT_364971, partial [Ophiobolus disseminans]
MVHPSESSTTVPKKPSQENRPHIGNTHNPDHMFNHSLPSKTHSLHRTTFQTPTLTSGSMSVYHSFLRVDRSPTSS